MLHVVIEHRKPNH